MIKNKDENNLIVALDVGTSKIVVIVAELMPDGVLKIIGLGQHVSKGLKKGVVVNIESTMQAIQRAVEEAELMADCKIKDVYTGIAGSHIKSLNSHGMVKIKDSEVSQMDIDRVIETAQAITLPPDQQVLHILTQEYVVDQQHDIIEPIGMSGMKLEVKVHIITGAVAAAQNIIKCIKRCGLDVTELVLQPLASAEAALTMDEKDLGVCLVDIGGGTTDIAVIKNGQIQHTVVIPIAGDQVTNDIAMALRTPTPNAEEIKIKYACALARLAGENETIKVPSVGDRSDRDLSRQALAEVVEPRYDELFTLIQAELRRSGFEDLIAAGIVLTGGTSKMEGVVELAEEIFHMPVSIGHPQGVTGLTDIVRNPIYSTAVGLLIYGAKQQFDGVVGTPPPAIAMTGVVDKVKNWFLGNY